MNISTYPLVIKHGLLENPPFATWKITGGYLRFKAGHGMDQDFLGCHKEVQKPYCSVA
jgi:hypothetical protein